MRNSAISLGQTDAPPSFPCDLQPDVVHVVGLSLKECVAEASALLDLGEQRRAQRFAFDRDRHRFVVAHAWVRVVIGRCLNRAPESLRFGSGPYGKPYLTNVPLDLRFNLSHAGDEALLAIALGREVGIDLEREQPADVLALAQQFFARGERRQLEALPAHERVPAFFRAWTRKESFVKAVGMGLRFPLDGFEVNLAKSASPQLLCGCRVDPRALERWRIVSASCPDGYAAALTAEANDWRVVYWNARVSELPHAWLKPAHSFGNLNGVERRLARLSGVDKA